MTEASAAADEQQRASRLRAIRIALTAWVAIVLAVLLWQSLFYRGAVARLAEWQYSYFGGYFAVLTVAALTVLLGVPTLLMLWIGTKDEREDPGNVRAIEQARRFFWLVAGAALVTAVLALAQLWQGYMLIQPGARTWTFEASAAPPAEFDSGRAQLTGQVLYDRQVIAGSRTWLLHKDVRFAPVVADPQSAAKGLTYFVEVDNRMRTPQRVTLSGMLVRDALRLDAARLFENAGYTLSKPHYVLYLREGSLLYGYRLAALKLGLVALILALVAGYQKWRIRKIAPRRSGSAHATR